MQRQHGCASLDLVDLSVASLSDPALDARVAELEAVELALIAPRLADRREANRRVGLAVNFVSTTPFMFASGGNSTVVSPPPVEPPPVEPPPVEPPPVEPPPVEPPPVEPPPPTIAGAGKVELDGIIQKAGTNWIVVNDQTVWLTTNTLVKFANKQAPREFTLGLRTELKGWPNVDGSVTAIKIVVDNER